MRSRYARYFFIFFERPKLRPNPARQRTHPMRRWSSSQHRHSCHSGSIGSSPRIARAFACVGALPVSTTAPNNHAVQRMTPSHRGRVWESRWASSLTFLVGPSTMLRHTSTTSSGTVARPFATATSLRVTSSETWPADFASTHRATAEASSRSARRRDGAVRSFSSRAALPFAPSVVIGCSRFPGRRPAPKFTGSVFISSVRPCRPTRPCRQRRIAVKPTVRLDFVAHDLSSPCLKSAFGVSNTHRSRGRCRLWTLAPIVSCGAFVPVFHKRLSRLCLAVGCPFQNPTPRLELNPSVQATARLACRCYSCVSFSPCLTSAFGELTISTTPRTSAAIPPGFVTAIASSVIAE